MQDKTLGEDITDQELVAAFIEKRLSDNLLALKKYLPSLYSRFKEYNEKKLYLICGSDGAVNLFDKEECKLIYSDNPVKQCLDNLADYTHSPVRRSFFIAAEKNEEVESEDASTLDKVAYVHNPALNKVAYEQLEVLRHCIKLVDLQGNSDSNNDKQGLDFVVLDSLPQFINSMFCFSVGLGFDVERLYFDYDIKNFCLIEPNEDVFYASLQLIDWKGIFEKSVAKGRRIDIIVEGDREKLIRDMTAVVVSGGRHNVAGSYLYSSFYKDSYKDLFKQVKDSIEYSYLNGFGFYDDARNSLAHTVANAKADIPLLAFDKSHNKVLGQEALPVIIVGNGPSLDSDIEYIFEHQNDFVIFSCGTSLRTLLRNNIQPDFHVELERTANIPAWIEKSSEGVEDYYLKLKKITLLTVSQVHPKVPGFFGRTGMVLKDSEAGSYFIHHSCTGHNVAVLPRLAPSCVHAAFTIAVVLGFKELYFFGTDMGTATPGRHHSKDSAYQFTDDAGLEKAFSDKEKGVVFKSNFGDKDIYSSLLYPMFKNELEIVIDGWVKTFRGGLNVFNCSDGALISGAEPKRACDILVKSRSAREKIVISDQVFNAYFSLYPGSFLDSFEQCLETLKSIVDKASNYGVSMISEVHTVEDALQLTDRFAGEFHSKNVIEDDFSWAYTIFDGSLLYMLSVINSTAMLPCKEEIKIRSLNIQFEELKGFLYKVSRDFRENALECDKESNYDIFIDNKISDEAFV